LLQSYVPPPGFSVPLALSFAGIEIIRRLLGVAQLPLRADDDQQVAWLQRGAELLAAA
jgi:5-methylthioribose kinase